jgi:hypothetical protein
MKFNTTTKVRPTRKLTQNLRYYLDCPQTTLAKGVEIQEQNTQTITTLNRALKQSTPLISSIWIAELRKHTIYFQKNQWNGNDRPQLAHFTETKKANVFYS